MPGLLESILSGIPVASVGAVVASVAGKLWRAYDDREARKESVVDQAQAHYYQFLTMCSQYPELKLGLMDAEPVLPLAENDEARRRIAYELLLGIFEIAHAKQDKIRKDGRLQRWIGVLKKRTGGAAREDVEADLETWKHYIDGYCRKEAFRRTYGWSEATGRPDAALGVGQYLHPSFRGYLELRMLSILATVVRSPKADRPAGV